MSFLGEWAIRACIERREGLVLNDVGRLQGAFNSITKITPLVGAVTQCFVKGLTFHDLHVSNHKKLLPKSLVVMQG